MRVGVYFGRHNKAGGGIGVFARSYLTSLLAALEDGDKRYDELVVYADDAVLTEEVLEAFELSPILSTSAKRGVPFGANWYLRTLANGAQYRVLIRRLRGASRHRLWSVLDQFLLPLYAWLDGLDVLHLCSNVGLFFSPVSQVVTVHDLYQAWPPAVEAESAASGVFRHWYRALFRRQFKAAAAICCDTVEVRDEIGERFPLSRVPRRCIELGVDQSIFDYLSADLGSQIETLDAWREKLELPENFALAFASSDPRKNLRRTLKGWMQVRESDEDLALVLLSAGKRERSLARKVLPKNFLDESVRFLDWLPREEFPFVLAAARVVLVPSIAEGFGLPAIEAASIGSPVVTSRLSALSRYEEETNLLFFCEPSSVESIAEQLGLASKMNKERQAIQPRTMLNCTEEYWSVYRDVVLRAGRAV